MVSVATYTEMKDGNIQWLGEYPSHWKLGKAKNIFCSTKTIVGDAVDNYERLALTMNGVIKRSKTAAGGLQPEKFETYQILRENELVFKLIDLQNVATSRVGRSPYTGIVSPAYIVLRDKNNRSTRYAEYFFLSMWMHQVFNQLGADGVRSNIGASALLNIPYLIPPEAEQNAIACYLDAECAKIDEIITDARVSIEDYKAWKASVLYEVVTKGTHKDQVTRDSGVKWIGSMPAHWQVSKIGRFINIRSGITLGKTYPHGTELIEMPYLRVANVKAEGFALEDIAKIKVTPDEAEKYALKSGELLMTEGGDRDKLGRGTIWHEEISPCLHQNHVFAVTCDESWLLTEYLAYLTASPVGREYFDLTAKKTTNLASTNSNTIMQFKVPIPPIAEQREIVQMLDRKCAAINDLITEKQLLISDLELYKKSLIYEVVTGKRKVV